MARKTASRAAAKIGMGTVLGSLPALRQAAAESDWTWQVVAVCERLAAVFLLLLALPVLVVCALVLWLLAGRSPLIAHRRVGWQGAPLWMLKLRTMWNGDSAAERRLDRAASTTDAGPGAQEPGRPPRDQQLRALLPAPLHRRASAVVARGLGRNVAGGSAAGDRRRTAPLLRRARLRNPAGQARACGSVAGFRAQPPQLRGALPAGPAPGARTQHSRLYCAILLRTLPEVFSGENSW